jgi:hypothetical protein
MILKIMQEFTKHFRYKNKITNHLLLHKRTSLIEQDLIKLVLKKEAAQILWKKKLILMKYTKIGSSQSMIALEDVLKRVLTI